ncbi:MAG: hypothetical protein KBC33_03745 [Candidatus Pacebacteria bacterium]|nr:hypothetical protein [Candidatus Paceibacterota bacterium]
MHHSDLTEIIEKAAVIVAKACSINHHEGKKGGYLCVTNPTGQVHAVLMIGTVPDPEKSRKYFDYCQEKAARLAEHRNHVSSWQSRDPNRDRWGGAIRCKEHILSFSGLPEIWDEAIVLTIGYIYPCRIILHADLEHICKISSNDHTHRLIAACSDESLRLKKVR